LITSSRGGACALETHIATRRRAMPTTDNARQGHVILSAVLATLALGVLLASAVMGWWVHGTDTAGMTGQSAQIVDLGASHG